VCTLTTDSRINVSFLNGKETEELIESFRFDPIRLDWIRLNRIQFALIDSIDFVSVHR